MTKKKSALRLTVILTAIMIFSAVSVSAVGDSLIAAGTPLGIRFRTDGVVITGIRAISEDEGSPALDAGLRRGDIITHIGGTKIENAEGLQKAIKSSDGEVRIKYLRAGRELATVLTPSRDADGVLRLGLWIRESASGIGTITFIDPSDSTFAGLGHGICDSESGALLPLAEGTVEDVILTGIAVGRRGIPGELHGFFSGKQNGRLTGNTFSGVTGVLSSIPEGLENEIYPVGKKGDVHEGEAFIFATVDGQGRHKYSIELSKIDMGGSQKNFTVTVTDSTLLEKTGGIVQGMSGSPIIQDGKLIGAVTHVLVSDPTSGYGIFIENMFSSERTTIAENVAA